MIIEKNQSGNVPVDDPPPYTEHMNASDEELAGVIAADQDLTAYKAHGKGLDSKATIAQDGRINVTMNVKKALPGTLPTNYANEIREFAVDPVLLSTSSSDDAEDLGLREGGRVPRLSVVVMIVGSRGDVQPFLALGQELLRHGHRVRIATHGTFREFIKEAGLEFYNIGGDPHELMSYMVRNPGLMPGWTSLTNGDIPRKQRMLSEILNGCWDACSQPDIDGKPFIADAIISNPPAFAHVHCAEALGIPLQLSFTMPWCPTAAFPHPLVNISQSNAEPGLTNYLSYGLAEMMTWQGLGGVINEFRTSKLGLSALNVRSGPGLVDRLKIPWTYCFSPLLVPRPIDWQNHIDVVGFYFLNLASSYSPSTTLATFLASGPPPIYIGFGSVVVEDPEKVTQVIFEATRLAGVRALISAGWGGLGNTQVPPHVFILGNVPHDWLFTKVFAVCHHGGAGTTAIGLQLGKPTIIVPFFGDQPFWGNMVWKSGAGPKPIKPEKLGVERLKAAIEFCMTSAARDGARRLGEQIRAQNGVRNGVRSFHQHLPLLNMRCDLIPEELAVWWDPQHCLKLSALAAQVLNEEKLLNIHKLEIHRSKEYDTGLKSKTPFTGGVVEALLCVTSFSEGLVQMFTEPKKGLINTTVAIPRSIMHILESFTDEFAHFPALYGSAIREPGRPRDWKSGFKEGGKAFFFGLSDGITGLWTEPVEGYKSGGWKGALVGNMRSYANLAMRPTAGAFSLITYPVRGALMSLQRRDTATERHIRQLRVDQGRDASLQTPKSPRKPHFPPPVPPKDNIPAASTKSPTGEKSGAPHERVPGYDETLMPDNQTLYTDVDEGGLEGEEDMAESKKVKKDKKHSVGIVQREAHFERHLRSLHTVPLDTPGLRDEATRTVIIQAFRVAIKSENVKKRKKAMSKRVQWVITKGGAGTIADVTSQEAQYFADGQITTAVLTTNANVGRTATGNSTDLDSPSMAAPSFEPHAPRAGPSRLVKPPPAPRAGPSRLVKPPPLPPRQSTSSTTASAQEWTREDEELFIKQLEDAKLRSLSGDVSGTAHADGVGRDDASKRDYEAQLLHATLEWSEAPHIPSSPGFHSPQQSSSSTSTSTPL